MKNGLPELGATTRLRVLAATLHGLPLGAGAAKRPPEAGTRDVVVEL
jgi:hypothetical protein